MIGGQRLLFEHVETGTGQLAGLQSGNHRWLIDNPRARGIDQQRAGLHLRQRGCINEMTRAFTQYQMKRDEIADVEQGVQRRHPLRPALRGTRPG